MQSMKKITGVAMLWVGFLFLAARLLLGGVLGSAISECLAIPKLSGSAILKFFASAISRDPRGLPTRRKRGRGWPWPVVVAVVTIVAVCVLSLLRVSTKGLHCTEGPESRISARRKSKMHRPLPLRLGAAQACRRSPFARFGEC